MSTTLRISVLDQSPISEGSSAGDALRNSIDLARHAEALGYTRYWVAEHHGTAMLACAAPEVLLGPIATATARIRIGSGGVMLPHYSPLKVAETFSMLSALAPGRVDLGLGRAAGTDPRTTFALQRDRRQAAPDDFPSQLVELTGYFDRTLPPDHPFAKLVPLAGSEEKPELWLLGSSPQSAIWAADLGLPYAFADFISPGGEAIVGSYRDRFIPSAHHPAPRGIVALWALCAETDEEAERLAASSRMAFTLFQRGELIPVPPIAKAQAFLAEPAPPQVFPMARRRRAIVGSPSKVAAEIRRVAAEYSVDEAMIVTITYEHAARRRSYELLARELGAIGDAATEPGLASTRR
jgi:luciferase family oxidoreductase group 1